MQLRSKGFIVRRFAESKNVVELFMSTSPTFPMGIGDSRFHAGVAFYLSPADARELARDLLTCADLASAPPESHT